MYVRFDDKKNSYVIILICIVAYIYIYIYIIKSLRQLLFCSVIGILKSLENVYVFSFQELKIILVF